MMSKIRRKNDVKNPKNMPKVKMAETQKNIAESQLKLQKIADGFGVQLVELKYDTQNSGTVGITVGFRIPNGGNAKNIRRHRDQSKAQVRHLLAGKDAVLTVEKTLSDIDWGYNAWRSGQSSLENVKSLMEEPSRRQTPRLILRLKHQQLMLLKSLNQTHIELLENYIELLHISGLLTEYPLRNWLHKNFQGLN